MSILSDAQIEALCVPPKTIRVVPEDPNALTAAPGGGFVSTLIHVDRTPYDREPTQEELDAFVPMIAPFSSELIRVIDDRIVRSSTLHVDESGSVEKIAPPVFDSRKIISRGLSSYGYDVSLSDKEVKIFTNINSTVINPKKLDERCLVDAQIHTDEEGAKYVILPPNSYMLGKTVEYFRMPRNVLAVCLGKSTYARAAAIVNVTPIEPGFEGEVVIEISNGSGLPLMIFLNEGIGQFLFFEGEPCRTSYADRGGKYQGQTGVTLPKV